MAAYGYAKINFRGRDVIFLIKLATAMIPAQVTMIPMFLVYKNLGLLDTHMALWITSFFGTTFGTFLLRQFFVTIPNELCESARIDGAGHLRIYWTVILPLVKPALSALMIFTFVSSWNNYETALIYLRTASKYTLPLGLAMMRTDRDHLHYSGMMAGAVVSVIPILLVFVIGQRYFIEGVTFTGIKG